ncbi:MAG: hypothetical protein WB791_08730 [Waddliaceae bacterium]
MPKILTLSRKDLESMENKTMIHEIFEDFAKTGINQLKDSLERLFDQLMIAGIRRENAWTNKPCHVVEKINTTKPNINKQ